MLGLTLNICLKFRGRDFSAVPWGVTGGCIPPNLPPHPSQGLFSLPFISEHPAPLFPFSFRSPVVFLFTRLRK